MPGGDRTGPTGAGPMTGRGAGYCAGYPVPGSVNQIPGRGYGGRGGGGRGRGRRNRYYATGTPGWMRAACGMPAWGGPPWRAPDYAPPAAPYAYGAPVAPTFTREQEIDMLKGQAEHFEDALDGIKKRLEELETAQTETT